MYIRKYVLFVNCSHDKRHFILNIFQNYITHLANNSGGPHFQFTNRAFFGIAVYNLKGRFTRDGLATSLRNFKDFHSLETIFSRPSRYKYY